MSLEKLNVQWWKKKRFRWALIGSALSFIGPLGEYLFLLVFQQTYTPELWLTYVYTEVSTLISFSLFGYFLGRKAEIIEYHAFHDNLTGVYNRGYIMNQFKKYLLVQQRYEQPFSAIMIDLDHFKQVNDNHGHLAGDRTLASVAQCIKQTIRTSDIVGRYGGEEFIVLCPNTEYSEVVSLAERIRNNISILDHNAIGYTGVQTASIGTLALPAGFEINLRNALLQLDNALYRAKHQGRNQVQCVSAS